MYMHYIILKLKGVSLWLVPDFLLFDSARCSLKEQRLLETAIKANSGNSAEPQSFGCKRAPFILSPVATLSQSLHPPS